MKEQLRFGLIITSDRSSRGERSDQTIPLMRQEIENLNWTLVKTLIIPDEINSIKETLLEWVKEGLVDIILTSGGTGLSPRDVTPDATQAVVERTIPGLVEAMRWQGMKLKPHAMLSRALAGMRGNILIINLPGNPKAAVDNFRIIQPVLPHAIELMNEDPEAERHH